MENSKLIQVFNEWYICKYKEHAQEWGDSWDSITKVQYLKEFYKLSPSMKFGVYQDFYDSVGMFINVDYNEVAKKFQYYIGFNPIRNDISSRAIFKTRPQAREQALKKAEEIWIEQNNKS